MLSPLRNAALVLHSSKAIGKEATTIARRLGRPAPHPVFGPQVELSSRDTGGLLDLLGIGKTLSCQRITPEEAPPALLEIEPACPGGNEDVVNARVLLQPGARLQARVTAQIVSDDKDIPSWIVGFNVGERGNVALGIARGRTARQFLAIAHTQRPIHPGFLRSATVIQQRFDPMSRGRPAWRWGSCRRLTATVS